MQKILTPDDIMDGKLPDGPTLVYDEDGYYMGGIVAERLKAAGLEVMLATPDEVVSSWAGKTSERWKVRTHLMRLGIDIILAHELTHFDSYEAALACIFTGEKKILPCTDLVMVTQRRPNDALYHECLSLMDAQVEKPTRTLIRIGDCEAPAIIAAATYAGHKFARELEEPIDLDEPLKHDRIDVGLTTSEGN